MKITRHYEEQKKKNSNHLLDRNLLHLHVLVLAETKLDRSFDTANISMEPSCLIMAGFNPPPTK